MIQAQQRGEKASEFVPVTMWITAVVYGVAALATFVLLKERAQPAARAPSAKASRRRWRGCAKPGVRPGATRDFMWLMVCGFFYQAGIAVVIALAAVYAEQVLGFKQIDTMLLVFLVNIAAALGAFAFGYFQDRIGHKQALGATLIGWVVMTVLAYARHQPRRCFGSPP